jgi:lipopolysaccharide transport system ATP-binding protein
MFGEVIVKVEGVNKKFCKSLKRSMLYGVQDIARDLFYFRRSNDRIRQDEFWALDNVSFELSRGECLGIIGPNGAGKSTLLKILSGIILPDKGTIEIYGRVGALIELGAGFHPMLTGRENIYINGSILGLGKKKIDEKFESIVDFAKLRDFIDTPVKFYSSGMYVRLGYAVAAHLNPEVMLVDEVLAVGDMAFKRKCQKHMMNYLSKGGAVVLVSHNMHLIQTLCNKCLLLNQGAVEFMGNVTDGIGLYVEMQNSHFTEATGQRDSAAIYDSPVMIDRVDIKPVSGEVIRSGEEVRVSLHYSSVRPLGPVSCNFSIWTADQWSRIATVRSRFFGIEYELLKGEGRCQCLISQLPLVAGTYALKAEIIDCETKQVISRFGWENAPVYFAVVTAGSELDNRRVVDGDLIVIEADWEK